MPALLLIAAAASTLACPKLAEPPTAAGLIAAERRWVAALEHRDAAALDCLLDEGFTDNDWRGAVRSRAQVVAAAAARADGRIELSELSARAEGRMGYVRGLAGDAQGKARFTDVFVYRQGRWMAVAAQETGVR